ncbi:alpha/beta fold hydrolase [Aquamicrobium segne]|uniref:Alpha/beta fold hydrolase n=1 Tax=Aquamicrobium segne TaxID=469547 RepID=A0ABW0GYC1_9HYPH
MTDHFFHSSDNPLPDNGVGGYFSARDGKQLRYARFSPTARPAKGTVIVLQGRNETIEKYFETIADLSARGLGTAIFDLRGQGASDRLIRNQNYGYVKSFHDYADDLGTFFKQIVLPDCRGPYYILAHSTGALIALLAAPQLVNRIERMVLLTPFLGIPDERYSIKTIQRMATALQLAGLGRICITRRHKKDFETNLLTSDPLRFHRNSQIHDDHPHLRLKGPTVRWLKQACKAILKISDPNFMARMHIPTLIVAAGADQIVSTRAIVHFSRHLRLSSLLTIDGARHELLQEADFYREQFLAAFDAFVPGSEECHDNLAA